jgi:hypothetical protein
VLIGGKFSFFLQNYKNFSRYSVNNHFFMGQKNPQENCPADFFALHE